MWHSDVMELMVGFSHINCLSLFHCTRTVVLFSFLGIGKSADVHAVFVHYV